MRTTPLSHDHRTKIGGIWTPPAPYKPHMCYLCDVPCHKFSFVARMFLHAFHAKCLTLFGTFICHSLLQACFIVNWFKPSAISLSFWSSYASLYTLLIVNLPFLFSAHITLSLAPVMLKGMLRIASAS